MKKEILITSIFTDNVNYYCNSIVLDEVRRDLVSILKRIKYDEQIISESFIQSLDLVIRQNLKNIMLNSCNCVEDLEEFQKILVVSENIISRAGDCIIDKYKYRWGLVDDVLNERIQDLDIEMEKLYVSPQIRQIMKILKEKDSPLVQIIKEMGVSKQRMSNLLRQMKECNIIHEKTSSADFRFKIFGLTENGLDRVNDKN